MSSSQGDLAQPRQELVKCVVVGDTAVGKTRLICARACNKKFSLAQLLNTHVPTVWAIDQYRIYKEVLEQSWVIVDGVNVSLRLWDTFGDHDKDRRFAYGRSDVVLLCFSVSNPVSLRNCRVMWYPEIRKFCPNTPILLVGCKNDLRYICKDEDYINYCKERSPLIRQTRESDLVMPVDGRSVAREIGVEYYETSVLSFFGVKELFDNVIRAALISRKQQRFWMTNLKRVKRPLPQVPFCPPEPKMPSATVGTSTLVDDVHSLFQTSLLTDVVLACGPVAVAAHRCILGAASSVLHKMIHDGVEGQVTRRSSDSSMVSGTFGDTTAGNFNSDTECLISLDHCVLKSANRIREALKRRSSMQSIPFESRTQRENVNPALHSITVEQWDDSNSNCNMKCSSDDSCANRQATLKLPLRSNNQFPTSSQSVINLNKLISPGALRPLVHFMYTGAIVCPKCHLAVPDLEELKQAAELLEVSELVSFTINVIRKEEFLNGSLAVEYLQVLRHRLFDQCQECGLSSDVIFHLEDGTIAGHRPILMARCDMMRAMFSGDFRESNAKIVTFPGVKLRTFNILLQYLYKDSIPTLKIRECLPTVELANRLCLPVLVTLVESEIVDHFNRVIMAGGDVCDDCLHLLEPLQMHNADQLVDWCLTYLASSYNLICHKYSKLLRSLHPENQAWLNRHRWPPVWYLKDFDNYERCLIERQRQDMPLKPLKRSRNTQGCLCFSSKNRRKVDKQNYCTM